MVVEHLGTHVRGGGQFLVARRQERDVVARQQVGYAGQREIEPGERRPGIAADESADPQPVRPVPPRLLERHPHQGLQARQEVGAFGRGQPVGQRRRHRAVSAGLWPGSRRRPPAGVATAAAHRAATNATAAKT